MKITFITLFPEMFEGPFKESIIKHAQEKGHVSLQFTNIRDFGIGSHKVVDDTAYGGGIGMVLRADIVKQAIDAARESEYIGKEAVLLMVADGTTYTQRIAEKLSAFEHLIIVCGHYEGIDERIRAYVDFELSIGDFVLTGGELPSMLIADSVIRLLPGVLKPGVTDNESFSHMQNDSYTLEYPLYTKPIEFDGHKVPDILLSGDHKKIEDWRRAKSLEKTKQTRPDLIKE